MYPLLNLDRVDKTFTFMKQTPPFGVNIDQYQQFIVELGLLEN